MAGPTIKTIAEEAGVSIATVSKALNDMPDVSDAVKARIREIARRQGYTINQSARQLASGHSYSVGVIMPDISERNTALIFKSLSTRLNRAGYSVYLNDSEGDPQKEAVMARDMLEKRVGVLIVLPVVAGTRHIEEAVHGQIPVVYIGGAVNPGAQNTVLCDDYKGGMMAARHLYRNGCRNSVVFTWGDAATAQYERTRGFVAYMQEHKAVVQVMNAGRTLEEQGGEKLAVELMRTGRLPTGLFATDDLLAIGAITGFSRVGVAVPRDISVVGYGNSPAAALSVLRLTSVALPVSEVGICTCDMALQLLRGEKDVVRNLVLEPQLIRRSTVLGPGAG